MTHALCAATLLLVVAAGGEAQGIATAGIRGTVSATGSATIDARIEVRREATGAAVEVRALKGRFFLQGLEPGGPYTIIARSVGFRPVQRDSVFLSLGELAEVALVMEPILARLDNVTVTAQPAGAYGAVHRNGGTGMTITPAMLERLPTLNRDLYDFVRLVPQISTKISVANPGLSAGGTGFRFNNFLINGVSDRTIPGGVSGAFAGAKSISLDAVQEYQVVLAPYDVRYGDFAGALVNAVTKSGSNTFAGSAFAVGRNDRIGRRPFTGSAPYERVQYGFSLGGPIFRNRLHFFVAPELQHFTFPAAGPYVGQPANAARPVPVSDASLARLDTIMRGYGLTPGSAGAVENASPQRNLFTRLDLAIPEWNSRLLVWNNYSGINDRPFTRADSFALSSYRAESVGRWRTNAVQLHTALTRAGGGHNEVLLSVRSNGLHSVGAVQQPFVRVAIRSDASANVTVNTGTPPNAQGVWSRAGSLTLKDDLVLPVGASHVVTVGAEMERFRIRRGGAAGSYGTWSFASLDDFARGIADRYETRIDFGNAGAPLSGSQYAAYVSDRWQAHERISLTAGLRADMLAINEHAPYHPAVDAAFGRRTDAMPRRRIELSPRLGFVWDVMGTQRDHIRGGVGTFTGRYPLAWAHTALSSYGVGGLVRCSSLEPRSLPPAFDPDHRNPPRSCAGASPVTEEQRGDVNLLDSDLRLMRVARASLAWDRRLPWNLLFTAEGLHTRGISDFVLVNLNLAEPAGTDPYGRVVYDSIATNGIVVPPPGPRFPEAFDLRNTGRNRAYQLSARLARAHTDRAGGSVAYTYSRARDAQTPSRVSTRGIVAWAAARATGGRHDDLTPGISSNDVPHRVVVTGTYSAATRTELSFYYVGESGRPFTYLATGVRTRGDLNADGSNANDPIYVPRNALDSAEMRFTGLVTGDTSSAAAAARELSQRREFEAYVARTPCLRRQRGRVLERNSCREPWSNTTVASLRQAIPVAGKTVEANVDVFNVLNLLNREWGTRREAPPALLEHVSQTAGAAGQSRPVFRFDAARPAWTMLPIESAFQLQLSLRYRF